MKNQSEIQNIERIITAYVDTTVGKEYDAYTLFHGHEIVIQPKDPNIKLAPKDREWWRSHVNKLVHILRDAGYYFELSIITSNGFRLMEESLQD